MNVCKRCKQNGKTKIAKMDVTHKIFNKEITVVDVPVVVCDECDYIEYVYPRELDFQLRDAYRVGVNNIAFKIENN